MSVIMENPDRRFWEIRFYWVNGSHISKRTKWMSNSCEIPDGYHWKKILIGSSEESDYVWSVNVISSVDPWMCHRMLGASGCPCDYNYIGYSGLSPWVQGEITLVGWTGLAWGFLMWTKIYHVFFTFAYTLEFMFS